MNFSWIYIQEFSPDRSGGESHNKNFISNGEKYIYVSIQKIVM